MTMSLLFPWLFDLMMALQLSKVYRMDARDSSCLGGGGLRFWLTEDELIRKTFLIERGLCRAFTVHRSRKTPILLNLTLLQPLGCVTNCLLGKKS